MLRMFFGVSLFDLLKSKWEEFLANNADRQSRNLKEVKDYNIGFLCLFYYVMTHHLSKHPTIRQHLQRLRSNPIERSPFEFFGKNIRFLLSLANEEESMED